MDWKPDSAAAPATRRGSERGAVAILFALLLPVIVAVAALAIDMGYAYWKRNMLQVDASAAALAGAGRIKDDALALIGGTLAFSLIDKDRDGVPDNDDSDADGAIDGSVILSEALLYAEKNMPGEDVLAVIDVVPGNWDPAEGTFTGAGTWNPDTVVFDPGTGTYDASAALFAPTGSVVTPLNAVLATARRADTGPNDNPLGLFLARAAGLSRVNINTPAIAALGFRAAPDLEACIVTLNPSEPESFYINGTAEVTAPGCNIDIHSRDVCALAAVGDPEVSVIDAEGEGPESDGSINIGGSYCTAGKVELHPDPPNDEYDQFAGDPFRHIFPASDCAPGQLDYCGLTPTPCTGAEPGWNFSIEEDGELHLPLDAGFGLDQDGVWFCGGLRISGAEGATVIFHRTIALSGGELDIASAVAVESGLEGTGFYLTGGARVNMHGSPSAGDNGAVGLRAQTDGPLADFVFFEAADNDIEPKSHSLRGTPLGAFEGILYFQNSDVEFKGTADGSLGEVDCAVLVADELYFNGTTQLEVDNTCSGDIAPPPPPPDLVLRLVD